MQIMHVVRLVMLALEEMHVVGRHQPEPEILRHPRQHPVHLELRLDPVIVHLEEKVLRPEDVAVLSPPAPCAFGNLFRHDRLRHLSLETAAQPDQSLRCAAASSSLSIRGL